MNQSQIDFLFQIGAALPERVGPSMARGLSERPNFGNRLAEATASATGNLPPVLDYRPPTLSPSNAPSVDTADNCQREQTEGGYDAPAADDGFDANQEIGPTDAASQPAAERDTIKESAENIAVEPDETSTQVEESKDSTSDDGTADEADEAVEAVESGLIAVLPGRTLPPTGWTCGVENGVADPAKRLSSGSNEPPVERTSPLNATTLLPNKRQQPVDVMADPSTSASSQPTSTAASVMESGLALVTRHETSESKRSSGASDNKSKKSDRLTKRGVAAKHDGDRSPASIAESTESGEQLAHTVGAVIETKFAETAANHPAEEPRAHDATGQGNSKSNTEAAAKNTIAVATNGVTIQAPADMPRADKIDDGKRKVSTLSAAGKNDLLVGTARLARTNAGGRRGVKAAGETDEAARVDPARFVGRVAKAIQTAHERGSALQLRLSPPELGSVKLSLTVVDGVMSAALETETESARRVLLDHLPALRERLAGQNIRIERFDVDVQREHAGGRPDSQTSHQGQQQHDQPRGQSPLRRSTAQPAVADQHALPTSVAGPNSQGINVMA
jgi:flagellar hook-length control protein FliK